MAWSDILGQDLAKRIFQAHLTMDRVPNAYLLAGPAGVGKRRLALEMAKALNCTATDKRPCDAPGPTVATAGAGCRSCGQITRGTHPDVHAVSPGGASDQVKIDQIRHVLGRIALRPFSGAYQIVILESAERLTEEAANSLLKALEEPSAQTKFLLTTTRPADCLPTIVSRCQLVCCHPLAAQTIEQMLTSSHGIAPETARALSRVCGGSISRALELARQWEVVQQRLGRLAEPSPSHFIGASAAETRQDVAELLEEMMGWLRDVAVVACGGSQWIGHAEHRQVITQQARRVDLDRCLRAADELVALRDSIDQFVSPRLIASLAREKWLSLYSKDE